MSEDRYQHGQRWLQDILQAMGYSATVSARSEGDGPEQSVWLIVDTEGLDSQHRAALLGDRAKPLDALQYLANIILNLGTEPETQQAFTVEFAGYRQQRQQELAELAAAVVQRVRTEGSEVEIEALTSFERRQIHTMLESRDDIETYSRGQEPNRHLVVRARVEAP